MTTKREINGEPNKKRGLCKRVHLKRWDDEGFLYVTDKEQKEFAVTRPALYSYDKLCKILKTGVQLNLLDYTIDEREVIHPENIIFDPDFLIEITSLCSCVQEHGSSPLNYILNLFKESRATRHTLLGEAANMFLDDCVNERSEKSASYNGSMKKFFREYPLQLTAAEGIDADFFDETKRQFANIRQTVGRLLAPMGNDAPDNIYIEPSFFCPTLGLQGRFDLLESGTNNIIELKSGKADEYNNSAKEEHILQMSLYKEILKYNLALPEEKVHAHLFYSRYPQIIHRECSKEQIGRALMLRNEIVATMHRLADGTLRPTIEGLTPDDLNTRGTRSHLWSLYKRPELERLLYPIQQATAVEKDYFYGNVSFIAREMRIGKSGGGADATKGGFADTWNLSHKEKQENGNILAGLKIKRLIEEDGVSAIVFTRPECDEEFFPNFRAGDTIFIYTCDSDDARATNRHVTRGTLTAINATEASFKLRHRQRNPHIFPIDSLYAAEHDHLDSTTRTSFREINAMLLAPKSRRELILAERRPTFDTRRTLNGNYHNEHINNIVLKAKQAEELFLLIGPPGTGKTSMALSSMVQEFYSDDRCNILLASFTNRAVDEICEALERVPQKPTYIRIGNEHACAPQYTHRLLKNVINDCGRREEINNRLQETRIIVGTISSLSGRQELFGLKKFDVAIVDEASQILESQIAGLLAATTPDRESAIKKFILIGDPKQLPAVVAQSPEEAEITSPLLRERGFTSHAISFFERVYNHYSKNPLPQLTASLYSQGRMHPEVGNFANKYFYEGILQPIPLPHQSEPLPYTIFDKNNQTENTIATRRTKFIATTASPDDDNPKINRNEAKTIATFVATYSQLCKKNNKECNPNKEIGIIVPFRNQIAMVTNEIARLNIPDSENIIIDTVERFQGSQRDIILYGTTISTPSMMEILSVTATDAKGTLIDRKLNVAITRARRQMFIFGVPEALQASPLYSALMKEMK